MYMIAEVSQYVAVASFAEAWIEIMAAADVAGNKVVASFAEAWIEITLAGTKRLWKIVASFAEAWIEIVVGVPAGGAYASPPSRRRGLKSVADTVSNDGDFSRLLRGGVD